MMIEDEDVVHFNLTAGLTGCMLLAFFILTFTNIRAPYGRYGTKMPCTLNPRVAWMLQECPTLICAYVFFSSANQQAKASLANRVLLGMFVFHYVNRTLVYPFLIRGSKRVPIATVILAFAFCTVNGYVQCRYLTQFRVYDESWLGDTRFIIGIVLFFMGFAVNHHSDHILRNLRKPGETGYKIPRGGMFEYVSGANFFGEILEWFGFAIANWSYPASAFAVCTAFNIGPRAIQHHAWYKEKFKEDYPKNRKALVPFVF